VKLIAGCAIEPIDGAASTAWLSYVLGDAKAPTVFGEPMWLLCHCDDGVTWGRYEGGVWRLGSDVFPDLCPRPAAATLLELRLFSPVTEVLIWRTHSGLRGRILRDSTQPNVDPACLPDDEERLLMIGRVIDRKEGFTRVANGAGAEMALPVQLGEGLAAWPRLRVRHYFACDEDTGCVRVVATRLVEVK
jgi:CRISPR-associated protein (TIGR03984 family)